MNTRLKLFALGFLVLTVNALQAQSPRVAAISKALPALDKLMSDYASERHFPGMVWGIVLDGQLIHTGKMGYADLEKKLPALPSSDFRIASMSKSFTAMAILKLRDAGKLKLDDPVSLYIPEMGRQPLLQADAAPVTIRQLLSHAAGFPEDNPWGDRQLAVPDDSLIALIRRGISFSTNPGTGYEYSNLGFAMLGYIIRRVTGEPYQTYITREIFKPLGMTHTYWEYNEVPADRLAQGYRWLNGGWVKQPMLHDGAYGAMGGLITNMDDFAKYVAFHEAAYPSRAGDDKGPIKRSSLREMHFPWNFNALNTGFKYGDRPCPAVSAYAYGLRWEKDCEQRVTIGHSGGLPGFGSNWRFLPAYGIGIISFANLTYAPASAINTIALDQLIRESGLKATALPVTPILEQRKQQLTALLPNWKNAEASGIFAVNFFLDYFPDSLRKEATSIFAAAGKIQSVSGVEPENNLRGSFTLHGDKADIWVFFTLTPENPALIQEYRIKLLPR